MYRISNIRRKSVLAMGNASVLTLAFAANPQVAFAQSTDSSRSRGTTETKKAQDIVITADHRDSFSADFVQAGTFRDARLLAQDLPATVKMSISTRF